MRFLVALVLVAALAAFAAPSASAGTIRFRTGTSSELSGPARFVASSFITISCAQHTVRTTSRNLRSVTTSNTSLPFLAVERFYVVGTCTYSLQGLCVGAIQISATGNWVLTADADLGGGSWSATVTLPASHITFTLASGCLSGCTVTGGAATMAASWTNASPATLTIDRQNVPFTTNDRTCVGVRSGTWQQTETLTETYRGASATVSVAAP